MVSQNLVFMRSLQTKLLQGTGPCGVRGLLPQTGTVSLINDLIFCPSAFFKNPDIIQICIKATHLHLYIISVVFRLFPMFCSHHYKLIPKHLHHSEEKTAHISSPSPLAALIYFLSILIGLFWTFHIKWKQTLWGLLRLASST